MAVQCALKQFPSLTSYFKSEDESQARFKRLHNACSDPLTEVNLLFFQEVLPCFTHCNQFLQREEPLVHVLQPQLAKMLQNLIGKYVKPAVLADSLRAGRLSEVDYNNPENLVDNEHLFIVFVTRQAINKLLKEGDISSQHTKFFHAAKAFFFELLNIC